MLISPPVLISASIIALRLRSARRPTVSRNVRRATPVFSFARQPTARHVKVSESWTAAGVRAGLAAAAAPGRFGSDAPLPRLARPRPGGFGLRLTSSIKAGAGQILRQPANHPAFCVLQGRFLLPARKFAGGGLYHRSVTRPLHGLQSHRRRCRPVTRGLVAIIAAASGLRAKTL